MIVVPLLLGVLALLDRVATAHADETVFDILAGTALERVLKKIGLESALSGQGPFTIFVPFSVLIEELEAKNYSDEDLVEILKYHIVADIAAADLVDGQKLTTLQGEQLKVTVNSPGDILIDNRANIIFIAEGTNGVVYTIDRALIPPSISEPSSGAGGSSSNGSIFVPVPLVKSVRDCSKSKPCNLCEGDCDNDRHCKGNLVCFQKGKGNGGGNNVPGCIGFDPSFTDWCIDPSSAGGVGHMPIRPPTRAPTRRPPTPSPIAPINNGNGGVTSESVVDILSGTALGGLLKDFGLDSALSGAGPFTIFAPFSESLTRIPVGEFSNAELTEILKYHVVPARLLSVGLSDGLKLTTLQGEQVTITINSHGDVLINDKNIIFVDAKGTNGVVHSIDGVLLPPSISGPSNGSGGSSEVAINLKGYVRDCSTSKPCDLCEGDCDNDRHCKGNLVCFQKGEGRGGGDNVPGCIGFDPSATDWCIDPRNAP